MAFLPDAQERLQVPEPTAFYWPGLGPHGAHPAELDWGLVTRKDSPAVWRDLYNLPLWAA